MQLMHHSAAIFPKSASADHILEIKNINQMPKESLTFISSPSCNYCAEIVDQIDEIKTLNPKAQIQHINLSLNFVDATANAIINASKNPKKMLHHIFKTQKIWLNIRDVLFSAYQLTEVCRELEDFDVEKIYDDAGALHKQSINKAKRLGIEALPTLVIVKKMEGIKDINTELDHLKKVWEVNVH